MGFAVLDLTVPAQAEEHPVEVRAEAYDAFWLWAGVRPQPALAQAKSLYLLYGEVLAKNPHRLEAQRPGIPHIAHADLWMVVRVETLEWSPLVSAAIQRGLKRWRRAGNRLQGLQIDFDSGTKNLAHYAAFLRRVRLMLPADLRLSITGLMDWTANAPPDDLDALAGVVDEMVVQTYQGRRAIAQAGEYLRSLDRLPMDFRIGLLQGALWQPPAGLQENPHFRGYVVFLLNP